MWGAIWTTLPSKVCYVRKKHHKQAGWNFLSTTRRRRICAIGPWFSALCKRRRLRFPRHERVLWLLFCITVAVLLAPLFHLLPTFLNMSVSPSWELRTGNFSRIKINSQSRVIKGIRLDPSAIYSFEQLPSQFNFLIPYTIPRPVTRYATANSDHRS